MDNKLKNKLKFPKGYFSFHDGVPMSHEQINEWIANCIEHIEKNKRNKEWSIGSGNTMVMVSKDDDCYVVQVVQGYFEKTIKIPETKKIIKKINKNSKSKNGSAKKKT
jgi:hypothetical protein